MASGSAAFKNLIRAGSIEPEDWRAAGRIGGLLWSVGGLTLALLVVLPGVTHAHRRGVLTIAAICFVWGLVSVLWLDWSRIPGWVMHVSNLIGLGLIALAMASTGGAVSPAWMYLFFTTVFAAYFYRQAVAFAYLLACVAIHALPLLYDPRAIHGVFISRLAIAGPAYLALGGAIILGRRRMWTLRRRAERLAEQQGALRRVATAAVGGQPPERIYALVAYEIAVLLGAGAAGILRLDKPRQATVAGSWADHLGGRYESGTVVPVRSGSDIEQALMTRQPVTIGSHPPGSPVDLLGYDSSIVAPIQVGGSTWGVVAVAASAEARLGVEDERRLMEFCELLAIAIASIDDRAKLAAQASSDPLTGLANHRALQRRLAAEAARATRHGGTLSVAVIDVDNFKQLNDGGGHETGDEMLVRIAGCLSGLARAEDTLGRVGGDEFAWVLPDTTREQALVAVERARKTIAEEMADPYAITVSAGICDTTVTQESSQLIRLADGALYWSKAHGRNQSWIYDPAVIDELSAQERAERMERSRALVGLRALARAIDAKDPATRRHSERVAELAGRLALTVGWPPERARMLSEAALVHDVGKIGVPDTILRKASPLTEDEREQIRAHAELAARIVEDVLSPEQVDWIRKHHERPDGQGYPRALRAHEIPEGAALLAAADSWDVMTVSRSYSVPKTVDEALAECVQLVGRQFTKTAVAALSQLYSAGELSAELAVPDPVL